MKGRSPLVSQDLVPEYGLMAGAEFVLECDNLRKTFDGRVAVDGVSFAVAPGEVYGLLGPNGAGKTTTIKMVCGLLQADEGVITIQGHRVGESVEHKGLVGYVPQDIALYPDLTARENLRFLGRLYGLRSRLLTERIDEALELIELRERGDERVDTFSGGMRRRLNIAAGLLHHPVLLVLDEPTVGVDPQSRHAILEHVHGFSEQGMAVVYTTHYMEEAERVCNRVGIIDHGRVIAEGTRRELVARLGQHDRIELEASGDLEHLAKACRDLPGVEEADTAEGKLHLIALEGRKVLPAIVEAAEHNDVSLSSIDVIEPDLEAVFLRLTGTALRE